MHAGFMRLLGCFVSRLLGGEWRALTRATKAARACRRLRNQIPLEIRDRDHRVVERRCDMHDAVGNVLLLFLTKDLLFSACFSHKFLFVSSQLLVVRCPSINLLTTDHGQLTVTYFLPGAFFFAMVARRGPLRVRAFVCVRWPRTGSERR